MDIVDEYPTKAILAIADILVKGKQQGHKPNSWRNYSVLDHTLAGIGHAISFLRGKKDGEPHLKQALCRLAMAVDIAERLEDNND